MILDNGMPMLCLSCGPLTYAESEEWQCQKCGALVKKNNSIKLFNSLIDQINNDKFSNAELTYVAEDLGAAPADIAIPVLFKLLNHSSSLVREGAIYGLTKHITNSEVIERLKILSISDPSLGIRQIAKEALE
jgi:hypothetical protein